MASPPGLASLRPLLRFLLPVLLFTAASEMVLSRVLTRGGLFWFPDGRPGAQGSVYLDQIGYTLFNFSVVLAAGLLALLGLACWWLRSWGTGSGWVGPALFVLAVWSLARGLFPSLQWTAAYQGLSLTLGLMILAAHYGEAASTAARVFVVLLGASLACAGYASIAGALTGHAGPDPLARPALWAGELLALACGALVHRLVPPDEPPPKEGGPFAHAIAAAVLAGLFFLLYGRGPALAGPAPRWSLGWSGALPLPPAFQGLLYAGVLFLFLFGLFRALGDPRWRMVGYGLAFLFLAGFQFRLAYQHLLGLIGLVLVTRGAPVPEGAQPPTEQLAA